MHRINHWLHVFNDPKRGSLVGHDPADPALFSLLVHVAWADGEVGEEEFDLLSRLFPGQDLGLVLENVAAVSAQPLELPELMNHFAHVPDALLALAERMALRDRQIHDGETELIDLLRRTLAGE